MSAEYLAKEWAESWNTNDFERLCAIYSGDDFVWEDIPLGLVMKGVEGIRPFSEMWYAACPDMQVEITSAYQVGDNAWCEWDWVGTQTGAVPAMGLEATNRKFHVQGAAIIELKDGKVHRWVDYWDAATLMKDLGITDLTALSAG